MFIHLHTHSDGSPQDGCQSVSSIAKKAAKLGMTSVALTDHGRMGNMLQFYKACKKENVKPILGCLLEGQEIVTISGVKNIEDIRTGDLVLTHKGRFRKVKRIMDRPYEGKIYNIFLSDSKKSLSLTEEHPILIKTKDNIEWLLPGNIKEGRRNKRGGISSWNSYVCFPKLEDGELSSIDVSKYLPDFLRISNKGFVEKIEKKNKYDSLKEWNNIPSLIKLDKDFSYFLGLYSAEGSVSSKNKVLSGSITFSFGSTEKEYANFVSRYMNETFKLNSVIYDRKEKSIIEVVVCCLPLAYMLSGLCGKGSYNKKVPDEILLSSKEIQKSFLCGALDGDGKKVTEKNKQRTFKVSSRDFCWGVKTLIASVEDKWTNVSKYTSGEKIFYSCSLTVLENYKRSLSDKSYIYKPIREISCYDTKTRVYNFEVEEDNSYVSDFVLHNCEFYVAPTDRTIKEKIVTESKTSYHLTVLAKNKVGLKNLFQLTSLSWLTGYYYKPRIDMELLRQYHEGLVVLSGCGSGRLSVYLMEERYKEASAHITEMKDLFKDDFYLEVQNHGIDWQEPLKKLLFILADKMSVPIVATQDSHYTNHEDSELHNNICKLVAGDLQFDSDQSWFKSEDEMKEMFEKHEWHAIERTAEVADKCNCEWDFGKTIWPIYDLPAGETPELEIRRLSKVGFQNLFGEGTQEYKDRLEYELNVITKLEFSTYFLVVADYIKWAKENDIPCGPGRGSGAGSLVAYVLGITEVDPIKYGLYFERFLNESRVSNPDFDCDFSKLRRSEVLEYIAQKYGPDRIAQIGTYAQFKPRGSLRAFARVNGLDTSIGTFLASLVPPDVAGKSLTFDEVIEAEPKILQTDYPKIVELARKAEGLKNQAGVHAAGVVIANDSISTIVPLFRGKHDEVTTQFDMHDVEEIGLVKYDFLGLKTLDVIKQAEDLIAKTGFKVDWNKIEDGDSKTYEEIFRKGDLDGVFQFETSGGFKDLCMRVKPESIEDLSTITALFRPGPLGTGLTSQYVACRNGKAPEYLTPELEPILRTTYGVLVYQEQIMRICTDVAGYTLPEADNMRKIIGKKLPEKMKLEREKFVSGCVKNKIEEEKANELFNDIEGFAKYSFNKAHSVAYSIISYRTAWLKAHYPKEFYVALMNNSIDRPDKIVKYIYSAKEKGISIVPPDVNKSSSCFTLDEGTILFGLSGIKGMGDKACEDLVNLRPKEGFASIEDMILAGITKKIIVALAECGGLEEITKLGRHQVVEVLEDLIKYYDKQEKFEERKLRFEEREKEIQVAIMSAQKPPRKLPKLPDPPEKPEVQPVSTLARGERLKLERKTLGFYLTGHPLDDYPNVSRLSQYTIDDILEGNADDKETVSIPVVISEIKKKRTRKGKNMAVMVIEDRTGRMEATVFPKDWEKLESSFEEDMIAVVKGRINKTESEEEDVPSIVSISINKVEPVSLDLATRLNNILFSLSDGSLVTFVPDDNTDCSTWQQAKAYVENVIRMGYK